MSAGDTEADFVEKDVDEEEELYWDIEGGGRWSGNPAVVDDLAWKWAKMMPAIGIVARLRKVRPR